MGQPSSGLIFAGSLKIPLRTLAVAVCNFSTLMGHSRKYSLSLEKFWSESRAQVILMNTGSIGKWYYLP